MRKRILKILGGITALLLGLVVITWLIWVPSAKEPGQFNKAIAVAVAEDGTVFVADYGNNRVQKWRLKR